MRRHLQVLALYTILLSFARTGLSQNQLYVHSNYNLGLYLVDLDNCSSKFIGYLPGLIYDIALSPDGQLYGVAPTFDIYKLDKDTGKGVSIGKTSSVLNALVYGPDNFLYGADNNKHIFKIDPIKKTIQDLGNCGYLSGGDLTFFEGELYLSTVDSKLIKINLKDVSKSISVGSLNVPNVLGIITVGSTDCQGVKPKMYATSDNKIYEIKLTPTGPVLNLTCTLNVINIGGAASLAEASGIKKKNAGKDSSTTVCFKSNSLINLQNYLPNIDQNGKWIDTDNSGSLIKSVLDPQKLRGRGYRFQYILGEALCADTSIILVNITRPEITKLVLKNPSCIASDGAIEVIIPSTYIGSLYSINSQAFQNDNTFRSLKADLYTIKIHTNEGCEADTTINLEPLAAPKISNIKIKNPKCGISDGEIEVHALNGVSTLTYSIDGNIFQGQTTFKNLPGGKYTIIVKDVSQCTASQQVELFPSSKPSLNITGITSTSCGQPNGSVRLIGTGGIPPLRFSIDSIKFQSGNTFSSLGEGLYRIIVVDSVSCTAGVTIKINHSDAIKIISIQETSTECGEKQGEIIVNAAGLSPLAYSLTPGISQQQPIFDNLDSGTFTVLVTDPKGCTSLSTATVSDNCSEAVRIPTAFTPNNDNSNDTWIVRFQQRQINVLNLIMYNRWGEVVYSKTNFNLLDGDTLWDGTYNSKPAIGNLFTYILEVQFLNSKKHTFRGSVYSIN